MSTRIKRHYVNVQGRRTHFRAGGAGPLVLLLHQSPQSSRALLPLAEKLASRYYVIAPDSPGFGLSAPLALQEVTIEAIAEALNEFIEAIQAPAPLAVFGVHTGAGIALEFGLRYPEKVSLLLLDGLALFNDEERTDILQHYLPRFTPVWDGSHLTWLWARLREQVIFFPWYRKDRAARLRYNMSGADHLHDWFMDFMYAGDHYRGGYGAAFSYSNSAAIRDIIPPAALLYRSGDVLESHRQRLPDLPDHAWTEIVPAVPGKLDERIVALLDEHIPDKRFEWRYQPQPDMTKRPAPEADYIDVAGRQLAVLTAGDPGRPALLLLHDLGRSSASVNLGVASLADEYYVICPDLPGHGESADPAAFSLEASVAALSGLLAIIGRDSCLVLSLGAACVFVPALIRRNPGIAFSASMHNPLLLDAATRAALQGRFAPPIEPDEYGTHITKLWYALRDGRLFWPWYEPVAANIRLHTPDLAAEDVHQSLFDALRCGKHYHLIWQAFLATDIVAEMKTLSQPTSVTISDTHPCSRHTLSLLEQLPPLPWRKTSDEWSEIIASENAVYT